MAVFKGIALAVDSGTHSCSSGTLAFDVWPQLAQGALGSSKGAYLTVDLGTSLALGAAPLTLDLEPLALGAHCLLIWGPCLFHGAPLALDLGSQSAPGAP